MAKRMCGVAAAPMAHVWPCGMPDWEGGGLFSSGPPGCLWRRVFVSAATAGRHFWQDCVGEWDGHEPPGHARAPVPPAWWMQPALPLLVRLVPPRKRHSHLGPFQLPWGLTRRGAAQWGHAVTAGQPSRGFINKPARAGLRASHFPPGSTCTPLVLLCAASRAP